MPFENAGMLTTRIFLLLSLAVNGVGGDGAHN